MLRLLVGIEDDLAGRAAHYPIGSGTASSPRSALASLPDSIRCRIRYSSCLAHRPLQAQQQPVVVKPGVVDAVRVGEQHTGQRAQLQKLMPVPAGPRQPRHLDPEDDAHTSHRHLRDEPGKPLPGICRRSRHAQVVVDHHDL